MSLRSLIALLTSVVAVGGLALVPTASVADTAGSATATSTATAAGTDDGTTDDSSTADDGTTDNSSAGDDTGALDPCSVSDVPDGGAAGDSSDSGFGDDTATDGDPGASAAQNTPDDQSGDAGDPNALDTMPPGGGDDTPGDTSDDNTCEDLGNGVSQDAPETVDNGEFSDGSLDVTYTLDQGGTVTATLTGNGASRRAVIAARHQTVYGRGHATSATGGKVKVRVRLTKAGRQAIRKARRTLHFTLRTHIALKDGSKVDHTKRITFKPATSKPKHKHRH